VESDKFNKMEDYAIFMRRYRKRIQSVNDWTFAYAYKLFKEKGEDHFLQELEDKEEYAEFCEKYYSILREQYNICSAGLSEQFQMYKEKFGGDEQAYRNELRRTIKNFDKYYG